MTDSVPIPPSPTPQRTENISTPAHPIKKKTPLLPLVIILAIVLLIAGGGAWYYTEGPCGVNRVNRVWDEIQNIAGRWDDANTLANSTPRMSLAGPIANLQSSRRELMDLPVPACLEKTRNYLADSMDYAIKGYIAFVAQDKDANVEANFSSAKINRDSYLDAIVYVRKCAPFCP